MSNLLRHMNTGSFVPAVLLGEMESKTNEQSPKTHEHRLTFSRRDRIWICNIHNLPAVSGILFLPVKDLADESDQGQMATQDKAEVSADYAAVQDGENEKGEDKDETDKEKTKDPDKDKGKVKDVARKGENEKEKLKGLEGSNLDTFLQRFPGCVSRDLLIN
ncbi:unnamed protein product [Ilex paraguariensis]|uniref:Uncharacterized protein n=1 Tax=Ilex paraguariensis TaxID=185542 RepID=A0ABC8SH09_9AQUA